MTQAEKDRRIECARQRKDFQWNQYQRALDYVEECKRLVVDVPDDKKSELK